MKSMIPAFLILASVLFFSVIRKSVLTVTVHGTSMVPTLKDGDRLLVLRYWPVAWYRRGQVVVINPNKNELEETYIKRIVGLEGDEIIVPQSNPMRLEQKDQAIIPSRNEWIIPRGFCFVQGDAPGIDSRQWGPIELKKITGIAWLKL